MTALKSLLFLILAPGMVAGYIPLVLVSSGPKIETGFFAYLAFSLWLIGSVIVLWSFWNFLHEGRGTPAPVEPPKELVAAGFYRYVRNPMYVGVLALILNGAGSPADDSAPLCRRLDVAALILERRLFIMFPTLRSIV